MHTLRKENASVDWFAKLRILIVHDMRVSSVCFFPLINICLTESIKIHLPRV